MSDMNDRRSLALVLVALASTAALGGCTESNEVTAGISSEQAVAVYRRVRARHSSFRHDVIDALQDQPFRCGQPTSSEQWEVPAVARVAGEWLDEHRERARMAAVSVAIDCAGSTITVASSPSEVTGMSGRSRRLHDVQLAWGTFDVMNGQATMTGVSLTTVDPLPHAAVRVTAYYSVRPETEP